MKYDLMVFIGRFQPLHKGHEHTIETAFSLAENVAVLCGSANRPRTAKNPWTPEEREEMIRAAFPDANLFIEGINDYLYDDIAWVAGVNSAVDAARNWFGLPDDAKIGLIGHFKDQSSYYLALFPGWGLEEVAPATTINATDVRAAIFSDWAAVTGDWMVVNVPLEVRSVIQAFQGAAVYTQCALEHGAIQDEKKKKAGYPYPNGLNDVTVDPVVIHKSGMVLLVRRGGRVGKGLLALPGGFLNNDERIYDGCVRELLEETVIDLTPPEFNGGIVNKEAITKCELKRAFRCAEVFDHPQRSQLGRLVTHAHLFVIDTPYLPVVKGSDDAAEAFWLPLHEVKGRAHLFHDDHADIIQAMEKYVR